MTSTVMCDIIFYQNAKKRPAVSSGKNYLAGWVTAVRVSGRFEW